MANPAKEAIGDKVIDIHIHIGGKGNSSPCRMSEKFLKSPAYLYMVLRSGIPLKDLQEDHDGALLRTILDRLNRAPSVHFGVFLAFDQVYRKDGTPDDENTHMVTPNDHIMGIARTNSKVLFGASVHPNRGKEAGIDEIDRCIGGGAVLIKWIPNSQIIDPADRRHEWFYRKLADENLSLLSHAGPEHAVPVADKGLQKLGDPRRLTLALDTGVKVIVAHCASAFFPGEDNYLDTLSKMLREADTKGWRLYADISAMCTLFRVPILDDILEKIPHDRMVLGSDYPIPIDNMPPWLIETLNPEEYFEILGIDNPIERNYRQLLAMDFPEGAMTRASSLLRIPPEKLGGVSG